MSQELNDKIISMWSQLNKEYNLRELRASDNIDEFFELLQDLSSFAPKLEKKRFEKILLDRAIRGIFTYAIFTKNTNIMIATFSVIIDPKFIHSGKTTLYLEDFVIAREYRGRHIGKMVLTVLTGLLNEKMNEPIHGIVLHTDKKTEKFYESVGFKVKGISMEAKKIE